MELLATSAEEDKGCEEREPATTPPMTGSDTGFWGHWRAAIAQDNDYDELHQSLQRTDSKFPSGVKIKLAITILATQ